ncbi:MAG: adenosylcobinamide-phosphate synthase CbiB [Pseudomonadota bacterium]
MLLALVIDICFGWPDALYRRIGHPVTWIGAVVARLEALLNRGRARRAKGLAATLMVIGGVVCAAAWVQAWLPQTAVGLVLLALLAAPWLAARSLWAHVAAVARPLARADIGAARAEVAKIVGRDPNALDAPGIARAALESLAENSSDGVVAPLFWGALLGLPGLAGYKAINTLDSMIGYRTPRYRQFGWAAARIDDAANWLPARLTALAYLAVSGRPRRVAQVLRADAGHHRSPNAGWPEAAIAAGLGVRLSGPRVYDGRAEPQPWVHAAGVDAGPADLRRGLWLYARMLALVAAGLVAIVLWP